MLESPLLGGTAQMKEADALFLVMTGGPDLNIGETKMAFEIAAKFIGEDSKVIVGTNTDPAYADFVQITAITVKFDKKESKDDLRRINEFGDQRSSPVRTTVNTIESTQVFEQGELPLQNISKGIFLNTTPVNHNGEDLDVPTYQRRMIKIDKGE
jgi:cell division GTPase FtsZ